MDLLSRIERKRISRVPYGDGKEEEEDEVVLFSLKIAHNEMCTLHFSITVIFVVQDDHFLLFF